MPFNKIAELGMEIGKAQLVLEAKDREIEMLREQIKELKSMYEQQTGRVPMEPPPSQ